jgi:5-methyltetrahydropteroyltriglutamate--homocysteine methyltransferase
MYKATKNLMLPTTITGSIPRPAWYTENLSGRSFSTAMGTLSYREQYGDALATFVSEQEAAGLDILVDGDARFDNDVAGRSWFAYATERLKGVGAPTAQSQPLTANRDKLRAIFFSRSWKRACRLRSSDRCPARTSNTHICGEPRRSAPTGR